MVLIENLADVKLSNLKTQDEHVLTQFCFSLTHQDLNKIKNTFYRHYVDWFSNWHIYVYIACHLLFMCNSTQTHITNVSVGCRCNKDVHFHSQLSDCKRN